VRLAILGVLICVAAGCGPPKVSSEAPFPSSSASSVAGPLATLATGLPFSKAAAIAAAQPQAVAVSEAPPIFVSASPYNVADYCDGNTWCASFTGPVWVVVYTIQNSDDQGNRFSVVFDGTSGRILYTTRE
jgi:hypothetical protein